MRRKIFIPVIVVMIFSFGCQKQLDKQLLGVYSNTTFYTTQAQAVEAINAAYQPLTFTSATSNAIWVFGDVASDDAVEGGNPGDENDINLIDKFNINASNGYVGNEWGTLYEGITRCNMVLAKIPAISMDSSLKIRILGEARFLRAWYYFNLVIIYGDVPIVLTPLNSDQLQIAQSPAKTIYESVIEPDLQLAFSSLPLLYTGTTATEVGRATSGAAMALLAKAYLYQSKWDSAATAAAVVINSNQYSLMKVYSQNFSPLFKNNSESVFEVQMLNNQIPAAGNALNQWFAPAVYGGYYFDAPTQSFVDEFEKTSDTVYDPRLDYTIGRDSMPWFNGLKFSSSWSPTGYLTRKHQEDLTLAPIIGDGSCDYIAIRYADVLLFYAEALNEMGSTVQALVPLNQVRKRARESYLYDTALTAHNDSLGNRIVPPNLLPDITSTDQSVIRSDIQHERRVELGFEFHRYFDVIRWGKTYATAVMSNSPGFNYDVNKTFPIPQSERDTDKALHP